MSTKNLRLHGTRKFHDHYAGPFVILKCIGKTVYHLDLLASAALTGVHNVFHVSLLCNWLSNRVHADMPPIEINGKAEYKAASIKGYCEHNGKIQYLTSFVGLIALRICS